MKKTCISLIISILPAAFLLGAVSCGNNSGNKAEDETILSSADSGIEALPVEEAESSESETKVDGVTSATAVANPPAFNGTIILSPDRHVTVTSPIGGILHSIDLFPGEFVRKGAVIASLENLDFIQMQQEYLESEAQTSFLQKEYERQKKLALEEAASQKRFQQSEADYLAMKSKSEASAARVRILGIDPETIKVSGILQYLDIKAPISGYVTNIDLNMGQHFDAGERVCDIIDKTAPMLQLRAYEKDLHFLKTGDRFDFHVNGMGDKPFKATLVSIDQMVNESNRSISLYLTIDNPSEQFRPGMYVSAVKTK